MSYRKINPSLKLEVIRALWSGTSYSQLSKKYKIPRATIYNWEQTAITTILTAFENKTPGKHNIDLEEENQKLKQQLRKLYHDKHNIAQCPDSTSLPILCQDCGSSHLKKNGTVLTKKDGLRQRYSCVDCSLSIYVEVKKTLPLSK